MQENPELQFRELQCAVGFILPLLFSELKSPENRKLDFKNLVETQHVANLVQE